MVLGRHAADRERRRAGPAGGHRGGLRGAGAHRAVARHPAERDRVITGGQCTEGHAAADRDLLASALHGDGIAARWQTLAGGRGRDGKVACRRGAGDREARRGRVVRRDRDRLRVGAAYGAIGRDRAQADRVCPDAQVVERDAARGPDRLARPGIDGHAVARGRVRAVGCGAHGEIARGGRDQCAGDRECDRVRLTGRHARRLGNTAGHDAVGRHAGECHGVTGGRQAGESDASAAVGRDRLAPGAVHGDGVAVEVEVKARRVGGHRDTAGGGGRGGDVERRAHGVESRRSRRQCVAGPGLVEPQVGEGRDAAHGVGGRGALQGGAAGVGAERDDNGGGIDPRDRHARRVDQADAHGRSEGLAHGGGLRRRRGEHDVGGRGGGGGPRSATRAGQQLVEVAAHDGRAERQNADRLHSRLWALQMSHLLHALCYPEIPHIGASRGRNSYSVPTLTVFEEEALRPPASVTVTVSV